MIVLWTLVITFAVAQSVSQGEAQWYSGLCRASGGTSVEIWGDPDLPANMPQSPHIAKCFRKADDAPEEETPTEFKPDV